MKQLPSTEYLDERLLYSIITGDLIWKTRPVSHFRGSRACKTWNTRYAGKKALASISPSGYRHGSIDNVRHLAHRVIWKLITGEEPPMLLDHEDTIPTNNAWHNLRSATKGQNNVNSKRGAGVHFQKRTGKWEAYTKLNGVKIHFGKFDTEREARTARTIGAEKIHGEFARVAP